MNDKQRAAGDRIIAMQDEYQFTVGEWQELLGWLLLSAGIAAACEVKA